MTNQQTSSIRFSVEESVWFKKGQEVSDLLAMSLEPEISVQEHEDYISIRGALLLTGDYHPLALDEEGRQEDEDIFSFRETAAFRTVDEVVPSENGVLSMNHRFPIDITIPTNRIRSLEDVYVLIEAFDYEIPEKGRLELKADICISGIANEKVQTAVQQQEESSPQEEGAFRKPEDSDSPSASLEDSGINKEEVLREASIESSSRLESKLPIQPEPTENKFPSFMTEVRKEPSDNNAEEEEKETENSSVNSKNTRVEENELEIENESLETERPASESESEAESVSEVEIPVNIGSKSSSPQIEMKGRTEQIEPEWDPKSLYSQQQTTYSSSGSRENKENLEQQEEAVQKTRNSENALYLTKMLSSDGGEDFSKLRIRIVQNGETLGKIADEYDISASQIIRLNHLENDILNEGQILYIPEYAGIEK